MTIGDYTIRFYPRMKGHPLEGLVPTSTHSVAKDHPLVTDLAAPRQMFLIRHNSPEEIRRARCEKDAYKAGLEEGKRKAEEEFAAAAKRRNDQEYEDSDIA